nr:hypothetical protein [Kitasatospora azatica]
MPITAWVSVILELPVLLADLVQRPAVHQLHHDVRDPRVRIGLVLAVVVDVHDAGVAERGEHLGLAPEPRGEGGVVQQRRQQDLDRHVPFEHAVDGPPDLAHPAAAESFGQRVTAPENRPPTPHM